MAATLRSASFIWTRGPDRDTSSQLLKRVPADDSQSDAAWKALEVRCQEPRSQCLPDEITLVAGWQSRRRPTQMRMTIWQTRFGRRGRVASYCRGRDGYSRLRRKVGIPAYSLGCATRAAAQRGAASPDWRAARFAGRLRRCPGRAGFAVVPRRSGSRRPGVLLPG